MNFFNKNIVLSLLSVFAISGIGCSNRLVKDTFYIAFPPVKSVASKALASKNLKKIAVLVLANQEFPDRLIEDELIRILIEKGYQVPTRTDINHLLEELNLQGSGFTEGNAAEVGRFLNVPAVLIVSLTQFEQHQTKEGMKLAATVGGRLISVEESDVLWIGSSSEKDGDMDHKNDLLISLSKYMAGAIPKRTEAKIDVLN